ncbi:hypothetical protein VV01_00575 [Luteipulveratus halotolerans]|uniref:Uncharacterized protein n=1 Tax=Luteipulveratus halotolerans TaxID=1631356 RepID=A0A0L6CDX3_9MICO|nr:hypothetical protein VV01_00575 [Luteipulveratus halotolerans]
MPVCFFGGTATVVGDGDSVVGDGDSLVEGAAGLCVPAGGVVAPDADPGGGAAIGASEPEQPASARPSARTAGAADRRTSLFPHITPAP